jgi:prevent-host-death family protein
MSFGYLEFVLFQDLTRTSKEGIIPIIIIIGMEVTSMDTVSIAEVKRSISTIVNRVAFGRERIVLTSRGRPKAALVSIEDLQKLKMLERTPSPPSRAQRKAALAMAQAVREMTLARRGGVPFSDVAEDLRRLREERDLELAGLH